jgi:hypothetical protein
MFELFVAKDVKDGMQSSLKWSFNALDVRLRDVLQRSSCFPYSFTKQSFDQCIQCRWSNGFATVERIVVGYSWSKDEAAIFDARCRSRGYVRSTIEIRIVKRNGAIWFENNFSILFVDHRSDTTAVIFECNQSLCDRR